MRDVAALRFKVVCSTVLADGKPSLDKSLQVQNLWRQKQTLPRTMQGFGLLPLTRRAAYSL